MWQILIIYYLFFNSCFGRLAELNLCSRLNRLCEVDLISRVGGHRLLHMHGVLHINRFDQEWFNHISNLVDGPTSKRLDFRLLQRHGDLNINRVDYGWFNHISNLVGGLSKWLDFILLHWHGNLNINRFDQEWSNHVFLKMLS